MCFRLVPKLVNLDDLELLQVQIDMEFCANSHCWESTTAKRMKTDPYCQRLQRSPMTLVSENIRCTVYADIREGFPGRERQMALRLSTTAVFVDFGSLRDKTINIT